MINYFFEEVSLPFKLKKRLFNTYLGKYVKSLGYKSLSINYIFCGDEYLLSINQKYLNHDFYTDTITFSNSTDSAIAGDVFISVDRIIENHKIFSVTLEEEVYRVMIHGFLHLLGYTDKEDLFAENDMTKTQEMLLQDFLLGRVSRETPNVD
ncbi:MAG: rRNA maturation RNase YbeY [Bacteroidales bacterium]